MRSGSIPGSSDTGHLLHTQGRWVKKLRRRFRRTQSLQSAKLITHGNPRMIDSFVRCPTAKMRKGEET